MNKNNVIKGFEDFRHKEADYVEPKRPLLPWARDVIEDKKLRDPRESPLKEAWLASQREKGIIYDYTPKSRTRNSKKE